MTALIKQYLCCCLPQSRSTPDQVRPPSPPRVGGAAVTHSTGDCRHSRTSEHLSSTQTSSHREPCPFPCNRPAPAHPLSPPLRAPPRPTQRTTEQEQAERDQLRRILHLAEQCAPFPYPRLPQPRDTDHFPVASEQAPFVRRESRPLSRRRTYTRRDDDHFFVFRFEQETLTLKPPQTAPRPTSPAVPFRIVLFHSDPHPCLAASPPRHAGSSRRGLAFSSSSRRSKSQSQSSSPRSGRRRRRSTRSHPGRSPRPHHLDRDPGSWPKQERRRVRDSSTG